VTRRSLSLDARFSRASFKHRHPAPASSRLFDAHCMSRVCRRAFRSCRGRVHRLGFRRRNAVTVEMATTTESHADGFVRASLVDGLTAHPDELDVLLVLLAASGFTSPPEPASAGLPARYLKMKAFWLTSLTKVKASNLGE